MVMAMGKTAAAENVSSAAFISNDMTARLFDIMKTNVHNHLVNPDNPVHILFKERISRNAKRFINTFRRGTQHMYAVKANPDDDVLRILHENGIRHFDVASGAEILQIRRLFGNDATLYYMHPKKSDTDISIAFSEKVKGFVADSQASLLKILEHPSFDPAMHEVIIRIQLPQRAESTKAALPLDAKFGATGKENAVSLFRECYNRGVINIGVSFHVGSQMLNPQAYGEAIDLAAGYARAAGITLSMVDVGGGFPAFEAYPHLDQPLFDLSVYEHHIEFALARNDLQHARLLTEPGRALVADAGYLVTRVIEVDHARRAVFINDGTYGSLFDAGKGIGFSFPVATFSLDQMNENETSGWIIQGVTCDSCDKLANEWPLPHTINSNDFIVFGLHGAYSQAMRTDFNGFGKAQKILV